MACLFGHKWKGCKCVRCGKVRDTGHEWNGCTCQYCGLKRDQGHDYQYKFKAKGCLGTCKICKKTIELPHDFQPVPGKCYKECTRCKGLSQPNHKYVAEPGTCKKTCEVCGKVVYKHNFVPVPGTNRTVCSVCGRSGVVPLTPQEQSAISQLANYKNRDSDGVKKRLAAVDVLSRSLNDEAAAALVKAVQVDLSADVTIKAMDALEKMAGNPAAPFNHPPADPLVV